METKKKRKRLYIQIGDVRIAPDVICAYATIKNDDNPTGVQLIFPNGRYVELTTTPEKQKEVITLLDKLKNPKII